MFALAALGEETAFLGDVSSESEALNLNASDLFPSEELSIPNFSSAETESFASSESSLGFGNNLGARSYSFQPGTFNEYEPSLVSSRAESVTSERSFGWGTNPNSTVPTFRLGTNNIYRPSIRSGYSDIDSEDTFSQYSDATENSYHDDIPDLGPDFSPEARSATELPSLGLDSAPTVTTDYFGNFKANLTSFNSLVSRSPLLQFALWPGQDHSSPVFSPTVQVKSPVNQQLPQPRLPNPRHFN